MKCTGMTASWCPIHGDCSCPGPIGSSESCPLHGPESEHAETIELARTEVVRWRDWFEKGSRVTEDVELALYARIVEAEAQRAS